jgi:hypothetical protein
MATIVCKFGLLRNYCGRPHILSVDSHCSQSRLETRPDFPSYRKLQILEKMTNSFTRFRLLPVFAWMFPIMQILLLFVVIKLFHSETAKATVFTVMYFAVAIFTIGIFSVGAKTHNLTNEWIKGSKQSCKNKLERRTYNSIMPLRLYFANNFVDTLTPCVIQDFCVRSTASLLLLGKK